MAISPYGKCHIDGPPGADGAGIGGGVYNTPGGTFSHDAFTVIAHNDASTSGDNIGP